MNSTNQGGAEERLPRLGRILEIAQPSAEDLRRASLVSADECPRRYCWWWRSLSFDWDLPASEGCTWIRTNKPEHWRYADVPCRRCDSSSNIDHFEPREPHIEADGIDASAWHTARKANHDQFP